MDARKALKAFWSQRNQARKRGIGWELTFKQWCDWWGEDYHNRGCRRDQLSMQRVNDTGPYALGNIRKGHPRDNAKTWQAMRRNRDQELRKRQWQALEPERTANPPDEQTEDERFLSALGYTNLWSDPRWEHVG